VTILVPFICALIAPKKSLKGLFEALLYFAVGVFLGYASMLIGLSKIKDTYIFLRYSKAWIPDFIIASFVATGIFSFVFAIVKYAL
jgi:hypothetical protein